MVPCEGVNTRGSNVSSGKPDAEINVRILPSSWLRQKMTGTANRASSTTATSKIPVR